MFLRFLPNVVGISPRLERRLPRMLVPNQRRSASPEPSNGSRSGPILQPHRGQGVAEHDPLLIPLLPCRPRPGGAIVWEKPTRWRRTPVRTDFSVQPVVEVKR